MQLNPVMSWHPEAPVSSPTMHSVHHELQHEYVQAGHITVPVPVVADDAVATQEVPIESAHPVSHEVHSIQVDVQQEYVQLAQKLVEADPLADAAVPVQEVPI